MRLHLFAPAASADERSNAVRAARSVLDQAGLAAEVAESAFIQLQLEAAARSTGETSPAMVRAAAVWRKAAAAAQAQCASGVLVASGLPQAPAEDPVPPFQPVSAPALAPC